MQGALLKICWLIDDPSWAMGVSLKRIASRSEHEHVYVTVQEVINNPWELKIIDADLFVCTYPPWLWHFVHSFPEVIPVLDNLKNVVVCLKSKRSFE